MEDEEEKGEVEDSSASTIDKILDLTKEEEGKVFVSFIFIYIERNEAERNTI